MGKSPVSQTPLHYDHVDGKLYLTLTQVTNKGFDVRESTFRLIVPHTEVPEVIERMLTGPDVDVTAVRQSDTVRELVCSDIGEAELLNQAYELIVAANLKSAERRALRDQTRLEKIAKAFCGISDTEWESLDEAIRQGYIVNALRAEQAIKEEKH